MEELGWKSKDGYWAPPAGIGLIPGTYNVILIFEQPL